MPDWFREIIIIWLLLAGIALMAYVVSEDGDQLLQAFGGGVCIAGAVMMLRNDIKKVGKL